ncbi:cytochrome P450 family protein [Streptomyces naganishii]|uniref:Cytochrome P450 n=1 Tax=Streptomyces naganishii JCM 4654 TaxID=1306179 RepID=A0A918Y531_9ACTN|nr:cytochrome P450 [Streptomyces naganishii]GHD90883.1 cytochrome P450 [Streptomyces naganishii JCM 4654]
MADLIDLTEHGEALYADPHAVYAELRELGPVHRVRLPGTEPWDSWLVVGYEEARAALADPRLSKDVSRIQGPTLEERVLGKNMLNADPPQHTRLRSLVTRAFTARRVEAMRPRVQEITDGLLDAMLPHGSADLVEALAYPLPITVICELLGVPEMDRAAFREMSNEVVAPTSAEAYTAAMHDLGAYLTELIEDKRCAGPADDLLSALIRTTAEDGDRLSGEELRGMAFLLLIAGHETTVNLISNAVRVLLTHPEQLAAAVADLELVDGVVEETLRYEGPVETATYRYAAEPLEIAGTVIAAGEPVLIGLAAADRDPGRFTSPDSFDIRRDTRGHLAFGHGIHYCLGAPLARIEARTALRGLLERAPTLTLDAPPANWLPGMLIHGTRTLRVRW